MNVTQFLGDLTRDLLDAFSGYNLTIRFEETCVCLRVSWMGIDGKMHPWYYTEAVVTLKQMRMTTREFAGVCRSRFNCDTNRNNERSRTAPDP